MNIQGFQAVVRQLGVRRMGVVEYAEAAALQRELVGRRRRGEIPDTLLSLQHPPTYTVGKRGSLSGLKAGEERLVEMGAQLHYTERGGDITFHGPGQAVLYPILSLRHLGLGARRYVEGLEDTMIRAAGLHGVLARGRIQGRTGVWVGHRKMGAIGVKVSQGGITSHGLAFNINPDLSYFSHILPCGMDVDVTSLHRELSSSCTTPITLPSHPLITEQLIDSFAHIFGFTKLE